MMLYVVGKVEATSATPVRESDSRDSTTNGALGNAPHLLNVISITGPPESRRGSKLGFHCLGILRSRVRCGESCGLKSPMIPLFKNADVQHMSPCSFGKPTEKTPPNNLQIC